MANRLFKKGAMGLETGIVKLYGKFVTSTSGTISSSSAKGFTITKTSTETGRYTLTLADKYTEFKSLGVTIEGAADAAYTSAKGLTHIVRGVAVGAATPLLYLQFNDPDGSPADAELEDGAVVYLEITLKNSSLSY